jgi:hypothetical protein
MSFSRKKTDGRHCTTDGRHCTLLSIHFAANAYVEIQKDHVGIFLVIDFYLSTHRPLSGTRLNKSCPNHRHD